ncbi:uncharacterized protein LOC144138311 [Haemaphysalis longicornis]
MNVFTVILLMVGIAIVGVSATSLPDCSSYTCADVNCAQPQCLCGSYKDHCGCCDICFKCANDPCNRWILNRCEEGYKCVLDDPSTSFATGGIGHCILDLNTTAAVPEQHSHV